MFWGGNGGGQEVPKIPVSPKPAEEGGVGSHLGVAAQQEPFVLQQPHEVVTHRGLGGEFGGYLGSLRPPPRVGGAWK